MALRASLPQSPTPYAVSFILRWPDASGALPHDCRRSDGGGLMTGEHSHGQQPCRLYTPDPCSTSSEAGVSPSRDARQRPTAQGSVSRAAAQGGAWLVYILYALAIVWAALTIVAARSRMASSRLRVAYTYAAWKSSRSSSCRQSW